jgi:lariat debranching enzyme
MREAGSMHSKTKSVTTHFLALDKPGPRQEFLSLMEIPPLDSVTYLNCPSSYLQRLPTTGKYALHYDEEWLAITRSFSSRVLVDSLSFHRRSSTSEEQCIKAIPKNLKWVEENVTARNLLRIPENFKRHAPVLDPEETVKASDQPEEYPNSQTEAFCKLLEIENGLAAKEENEDAEWIVFE